MTLTHKMDRTDAERTSKLARLAGQPRFNQKCLLSSMSALKPTSIQLVATLVNLGDKTANPISKGLCSRGLSGCKTYGRRPMPLKIFFFNSTLVPQQLAGNDSPVGSGSKNP